MTTLDPQHEAVREVTGMLQGVRGWSRRPEAQRAYLDDVADLCREVSFILSQARGDLGGCRGPAGADP